MDTYLLQKILSNTYTKPDFYRSINVVQEFLEHAFYNTDDADDSNHTERIVRQVRMSGDIAVAERIEQWGDVVLSVFTRENLYEKLKELKDEIEGLSEFVLYVPTAFGPREVELIGQWCRENMNRTIVLNFVVEPDAVGGCAFVWEGVYYDFSLDHFIKKKEAEIARIILSYNAVV
jgi:hypothetical protein